MSPPNPPNSATTLRDRLLSLPQKLQYRIYREVFAPPKPQVIKIDRKYRGPSQLYIGGHSRNFAQAYYSNSVFVLSPGHELPFIQNMPEEHYEWLADVRKLKSVCKSRVVDDNAAWYGLIDAGVVKEYEYEVEIWEELAREGWVEKVGRDEFYFY